MVIDDYDAYQVLAALRRTGIDVAIDDFGTGYSALSYLEHLLVDVIKIDRRFVAALGADRVDSLLVEAIICHSPRTWPAGDGRVRRDRSPARCLA